MTREQLSRLLKKYVEPLNVGAVDVVEAVVRGMYKTEEHDLLIGDVQKMPSGLWLPNQSYIHLSEIFSMSSIPTTYGFWFTGDAQEEKSVPPPEPEFEVNMMEALVGWKVWTIHDGRLWSQHSCNWKPLVAIKAECHGKYKCGRSPVEACSCGIYAADRKDYAPDSSDHDEVLGLVYGWGRYVRGEAGWRAQYAYPKAFYLSWGQESHIDPLKAYGVPIHITAPMQVYDPKEDGYEHGNDETDGDSRAAEITSAYQGDEDDED